MNVVTNALDIVTDIKSFYDYYAIGGLTLILLAKKLHLPLPIKYHRDELMICSEAVAEAFWRSGIEIVPPDNMPLPVDFLKSGKIVLDGVFDSTWI
jgi:hypothetical protein